MSSRMEARLTMRFMTRRNEAELPTHQGTRRLEVPCQKPRRRVRGRKPEPPSDMKGFDATTTAR